MTVLENLMAHQLWHSFSVSNFLMFSLAFIFCYDPDNNVMNLKIALIEEKLVDLVENLKWVISFIGKRKIYLWVL